MARTPPIRTMVSTAFHRRCLQLVEPTDRRDACAPLQKSKSSVFLLCQPPVAFRLLKCSAGVSPAGVCRSVSGETPDLHKSLLKSTTLETLVSSLLYQCLFEIGLCITKEGGMAVSAVLRLLHLLAPYPSEPWYPPPHTGGTPVPLSKSPKGIDFWY